MRNKILNALLSVLKTKAVEVALAKLVGATAGFKAWLVKFVVEYFFDTLAEPVIKLALRKGQLVIDKRRGKIVYKKVMDAKDKQNKDDYLDSIGDA